MADTKVDWNKERVLLIVKNATQKGINAVAADVEGQTKINIQSNGQIDTGFMLNSTYMHTPNASTYAQAKAAAENANPDAQMHAQVPLPQNAAPVAAVAVAAEYAIFQETTNSFLYRALEQEAAKGAATLARVAREEMHD